MTECALLKIEVNIIDSGWNNDLPRAKEICHTAATTAWHFGNDGIGSDSSNLIEVSILLASDSKIHTLNRNYCGKNAPTNVLSFSGSRTKTAPEAPQLLGDIVIARETIITEAHKNNKSLEDYFCHMVVHGMLHLLGYNHDLLLEAHNMEELETYILADLGITAPYTNTNTDFYKT